jgi:hypothetical protein
VERALRRRGILGGQPLDDAVADAPEVASLVRESVAYPSNHIVDPAKARPVTDATTPGAASGFNLHAGTTLGAMDRDGRERLARYLLRPPLSDDRLALRDDGKVEMALKTPRRDGTVALVMTSERLVARLAALMTRPRTNMVRYHGILLSNSAIRSGIVPSEEKEPQKQHESADSRDAVESYVARPPRHVQSWPISTLGRADAPYILRGRPGMPTGVGAACASSPPSSTASPPVGISKAPTSPNRAPPTERRVAWPEHQAREGPPPPPIFPSSTG